MWYPVALLGAAFLLQVVAEDPPHNRTKRLTAFGKSPNSETDPKMLSETHEEGPKLYVPYTKGSTVPKGKDCRGDEDCAALEFTTCKVDTDQKRRCLCHDYQPPANGECATKKRDVRGYVLIGNKRPQKDDVGELFWPDSPRKRKTTIPPPLFEPYADGYHLELHQNCNYDHECIHGAECIVNSTLYRNEKRCYCRFGYTEEENVCNSGSPINGLFVLVMLMTLALLTSQRKQVVVLT